MTKPMVDVADVGRQISPRFQLVNAIPAATAVVFVVFLQLLGAFSGPPDLSGFVTRIADISLQTFVVSAFVVLLVAIAINSFQTKLVKVLEGYWSPSGPRLVVLAWSLRRHQHRRMRFGVRRAVDPRTLSRWQLFWFRCVPADLRWPLYRRYAQWIGQQADLYPEEAVADEADEAENGANDDDNDEEVDRRYGASEDRLLPTRLGNVLRSAEDRAGRRYGLDAVSLAPHLLAVASADTVAIYEDAREEIDVNVKFVFVWMFNALVSLVVLLNDGPWLLLPLLCFGLSYLAYRSAILAAAYFGDVLCLVVDLHRFDLLQKLHWRLPANLSEERANAQPLWRVIQDKEEPGDDEVFYRHH